VTSAEMVSQWRKNEMTDINRAVEAEIPCLRRYARKLTRDDAAAEDLLQECLVRGLGKHHLWREGTNLRAWLCTILHNLYVNEIRRSVREGVVVELSKLEGKLTRAPTQDKGLELRDLNRALTKLSEGQRAAVILVGLEGLKYEKVAEATGVPIGTVRSRLARGRKKLRMAA
jgi:RNA polymerase sigma-70 factor (ECF subfamily)